MTERRRPAEVPDYWPRRNEVLPSFPKYVDRAGRVCLEARDVSLRFGGTLVLDKVSLDFRMGEVHAIVGPNGAGKSSFLNCVNGLYKPCGGSVVWEGRDVTGLAPQKVAALGIGRAFQRLALFRGMTVLQNVLVGRHGFIRTGPVGEALYLGRAVREDVAHQALCEEILEFLEIEHLRDRRVRDLSYGMQKRVEFARALALEPRLLLLDEPVAGMNLEEKQDVARFVLDIVEELGVGVVLIEHELDMVMDVSDRVSVFNYGKVLAQGSPAEVIDDPAVAEAYLGRRRAPA